MAEKGSKKLKRGNNEGSIRYREDRGKWEAQVTVKGKRVSKLLLSRSEAQKWIREMNNSLETGLTAQIARASFRDALVKWLSDGKHRWELRTYEQYDNVINHHIVPYLPRNLKVMDVKPLHIQELVDLANENGVGVRTRQYIRTTLHCFFEDLCFQRIFQYNPTQGVVIGYEPPEMKTLSPEQVNQLLAAAKDSRFDVFYYLAIVTGMREGELLGLKWGDVDWASQSIKVQRQVQWKNKSKGQAGPRYFYKTPKSKAGIRRIALGGISMEKLKLQKNRAAMQRLLAGEKWEEQDLVFPNLFGRPIEATNLVREFNKLLARANLPKIRIHDLRHTAATMILLMNIHPKIVSERLGHSDIRITLQLYSHAIPTLQNEAAARMDAMLNPESFFPNQPAETLAGFEKSVNS